MKKRVWEHRIPTIPAFLLIMVGMWVTLYLLKNQVFFTTRAAPDVQPEHITVGNVSATSFAIGFTTRTQIAAGITINRGTSQFVQFDDRDTEQTGQKAFFAHFFTIKELQPNTTYSFTLLLDGQTYTLQGQPYTVKTATISSPSSRTVSGSVILPTGSAADDALVLINSDTTQPLLTVTQANGNYSILVPTFLNKDLSSPAQVLPQQEFNLHIYRELFSSLITVQASDLATIPPIALSQNYEFLNTPPADTGTISSGGATFSLPIPSTTTTAEKLTISTPANTQSFVDNQPVFKGTGPPGTKIKIIIHSTPLEAEVLTDKAGRWTFRPNFALSQGDHTITIQLQDSFGILRSVTRSFSVFPSGSQVSDSATPSATPTFAPTSMPTPTVAISTTPSITSVPTPTTILPTATIAPTSTLFPTATPFLTITPTKPGSVTAVVITLVSVVFIIAGTTLLFVLT